MGRKITFDETLALQLYHARKIDREIAEVVGASEGTIQRWRYRRGLASNCPPNERMRVDYLGQTGGVDYRTVLDPDQQKEMRRFLNLLLYAGEKAVKAGVKPDVSRFMEIYVGRPLGKEDVLREQRQRGRDKVARIRKEKSAIG